MRFVSNHSYCLTFCFHIIIWHYRICLSDCIFVTYLIYSIWLNFYVDFMIYFIRKHLKTFNIIPMATFVHMARFDRYIQPFLLRLSWTINAFWFFLFWKLFVTFLVLILSLFIYANIHGYIIRSVVSRMALVSLLLSITVTGKSTYLLFRARISRFLDQAMFAMKDNSLGNPY